MSRARGPARSRKGPVVEPGAEKIPELALAAPVDPEGWRNRLRDRLLAWYRANRRDLPWRSTRDPYRIWLSEVMLQQTQVETVIPYYHRFLERFPDLASLAAATEEEILKAWEGLGFYRRARLFRQAASELAAAGEGVPDDPARFRCLPGVGQYTAGAVMSIAFGHRLPAVDGNAFRVLSRWSAQEAGPDAPEAQRAVEALAAWLVPAEAPGDWNQAVMELGARMCLPGNRATCSACPLAELCLAGGTELAHRIPPPRQRAAVREVELALALIRKQGRVLMRQRPSEGLLAGFWELPGVEAADGAEVAPGALAAALQQLLGEPVRIGARRLAYTHRFSHRLWRVQLYEVDLAATGGEVREGAGDRLTWVAAEELGMLPVAAAHRPAVEVARQDDGQDHQQDQERLQRQEPGP